MIQLRQTVLFTSWLRSLRDKRAVAAIARRLQRLSVGHQGDVKFFDGIGELRIDLGPGYRVYFVRRDEVIIFLLCGGDKSTQTRDIEKARALAKEL
jgi:putative addiction module killer protein